MTGSEICEAIVNGKIDKTWFPRIMQAIQHVQEVNRPYIRVGDKVKVYGNVNPKYLVGLEATVIKVNDKSYKIRLLSARGRFRMGQELRAPKSIIDKV